MNFIEFKKLGNFINENFQWVNGRKFIKYVNFDLDCRGGTVWKVRFRTYDGEQIGFIKKYGEDFAKTIYKYLEGLL